MLTFYSKTLLRFNLQPVNPTKPFIERCVGFFLHTDMMFRVTKREDSDIMAQNPVNGSIKQYEVAALPGAPDE